MFRSSEFTVGDWAGVANSASFTFGKKAPADDDVTGVLHARAGAALFTGLSGYFGNVRGDYSLNAIADRGENFMIVSMSDAGAEALAKAGGVLGYKNVL